MTTEENKAMLRRFIELWNTGKLASADEFVSPALVDHTLPPGLPPDLEGFKLFIGAFRAAFPDLHITIDELIAQGDLAAARVTFHGIQQGEFLGIPATHQAMSMGAIGMLRFAGGQVVEHWAVLDRLGMLAQLGVAPAQSGLPYEALWPAHGASPASAASDPQANLTVVRRYFDEVCNARRLEAADELFTPDHRYHDPSIPVVSDGPAGIRQSPGPVLPYQQGFSDAHWTVEAMIAEGDSVVTRWVGHGRQDGDLPGIRATGRQVEVPGMYFQRLQAGRIAETWQVWDTLEMLQQLGVIPAPESAA